jgi:hypothetical protein
MSGMIWRLIGITLLSYSLLCVSEIETCLHGDQSCKNALGTNTLAYSSSLESLDGWKFIGKYDNVNTYIKTYNGSDLLAVRGTYVANMHISRLLVPFFNATANPLWLVLYILNS